MLKPDITDAINLNDPESQAMRRWMVAPPESNYQWLQFQVDRRRWLRSHVVRRGTAPRPRHAAGGCFCLYCSRWLATEAVWPATFIDGTEGGDFCLPCLVALETKDY